MSNASDTDADGGDSEPNAIVNAIQTIVPDVIRRNFALKFALVLLVMGAIIAGIGVVGTGMLSDGVEDNAENEYQRAAAQQATIVEKWIERNAVSTQLLSGNSALTIEVTNQTRVDLNQALSDPTHSIPPLRNMHLLTRSDGELGFVGSNVHPTPAETNIADTQQSWVLDRELSLASNDIIVSDVYTVSGTDVIGILTPLEGRLDRYLVAEYNVDELAQSLETTGDDGEVRENHFTQLVNGDGTVQADSRTVARDAIAEQATVQTQYGNQQTLNQARDLSAGEAGEGNASAGVRIVEGDSVMDEEYAVGYARIDAEYVQTDWVVLTHAPTSDVFGFVRTITQWGRIATFAGLVLIVVVGAGLGYTTTSAINRLRRKAEEMEAGNLEVEINSTRIDSIGRLYDSFANMRDALSEQIQEAEQARKEAEVSRAEAMEMNQYLQEKAEEYSEIMEQCAAGDLTRRMDMDGENESMDRIATEFNQMIEELEKTTGQLKHFADEVEEAGNTVETSAESVRDASEQVADSIQRISDDAYDQQERLDELSASLDDAIDQIESVVDAAEVDDSIEQLRGVTDAINDLADLTEDMMAESENVAGAAEEQAAELNSVSQQAGDLTRYARPLKDVLDSFETEEEHEFYFPTGPGSPQADDEDA